MIHCIYFSTLLILKAFWYFKELFSFLIIIIVLCLVRHWFQKACGQQEETRERGNGWKSVSASSSYFTLQNSPKQHGILTMGGRDLTTPAVFLDSGKRKKALFNSHPSSFWFNSEPAFWTDIELCWKAHKDFILTKAAICHWKPRRYLERSVIGSHSIGIMDQKSLSLQENMLK